MKIPKTMKKLREVTFRMLRRVGGNPSGVIQTSTWSSFDHNHLPLAQIEILLTEIRVRYFPEGSDSQKLSQFFQKAGEAA